MRHAVDERAICGDFVAAGDTRGHRLAVSENDILGDGESGRDAGSARVGCFLSIVNTPCVGIGVGAGLHVALQGKRLYAAFRHNEATVVKGKGSCCWRFTDSGILRVTARVDRKRAVIEFARCKVRACASHACRDKLKRKSGHADIF